MSTPTSSSPTSTTSSAPTVSCTTAVPGKNGYVPPDACNAQWAYDPSFATAVAFTTLFSLLAISHIVLAFVHRKGFSWVMIMGVLWEVTAFAARTVGSRNQQSQGLALVAQLFFLLAPLWINAYVYMTAGRLIWTYHPAKKVFGVKAVSTGKYFVWLDIFSFLVQATGGTMLQPGSDASTMKTGKTIYMLGVGVQQGFIVLFTAVILRFQFDVQRLNLQNRRWLWVTYALYATLILISIRIIFRLVEFSAGVEVSNPLPYHEVYAMVLDAFPMVLACLIMAVVHPGIALKGPESEFPSRKERKAEKKRLRAEKKMRKQERKGFELGHRREEPLLQRNTAYEPLQSGERGSRMV